MPRPWLVVPILAGLCSAPVAAEPGDLPTPEPEFRIVQPQMTRALRSSAARPRTAASTSDTTWVGYHPGYAASNYWSIGVGARRPPAGGDDSRRGYWDFETPVHGDTLQGWSAHRRIYNTTGGQSLSDELRPWWAVDNGNQVNEVGRSGPANAYGQKHTAGVIGAWHADPGNVVTAKVPGTNPVPPSWAPLAGARSAWCGLRGHGDLTAFDPITGNHYNQATNTQTQVGSSSTSGYDGKFPGYPGQWDQMLYRDVAIPPGGTVQVRFTYRTNMSTGFGTTASSRTGWFDKDPLTVVPGNYVKSTGSPSPPADSFMVYVGRPVERLPGADNDWTGSDGLTRDLYDPLRRWFAEVVHAFDGTHHRLFGTRGDNSATTVTVSFDAGALAAEGYGGVARLVFRVKTNRGFDDDFGSVSGAYSSGYAGAAVLDAVEVDTGSGFEPLGGFEPPASPADSALTIDNDPAYSALERWKATGKPPGTYAHHHELATLAWEDVCGPAGTPGSRCNMIGTVASFGDHDRDEALHGPAGTAEREINEALSSPVVNFVTPGPATPNDMGLTGDMVDATLDYHVHYEIYTGAMNLLVEGNAWQLGFQSYPAVQADGTRAWGNARYHAFSYFNPTRECFEDLAPVRAYDMLRTSNANGIPDSVRIIVRNIGQCFRFGIGSACDDARGLYVDNLALGLVDAPTPATAPITVDPWNEFQDAFPANETATLPGTAAFDTCAAWVQTGINRAERTYDLQRPVIAGDSAVVASAGDGVRMDLVFRIAPGPGSYVVPGDRASGLRARPDVVAPLMPGDGSFWSAFLGDHGDRAGAYGHGIGGPFAMRWNPLAWNSARMDTAESFLHPVLARGVGQPEVGRWATTYHESDPHVATLGILRNLCFVNDTAGFFPLDVTCGRAGEAPWPPAWVTAVPASRTGAPPGLQSSEMTKILPDGLFTPGTHVQYFFRREDAGGVALAPDTSLVAPQPAVGSLDARRWLGFAVLPDRWKAAEYGGLGQACMLVVDWADGHGDEAAWTGAADTLGLTSPDRRGAHNGWSAAGGQDPNDPAARVHANAQAGTHWDLFNVLAGDQLDVASGTIGSRLAARQGDPAARGYGKEARNAPTPEMLAAYYRLVVLLTGEIGSGYDPFGPQPNQSADDKGILQRWMTDTLATGPRGLWAMGNGFAEGLDGDPLLADLGVALSLPSYYLATGGGWAVSDLRTQPLFGEPGGDVYGVRGACVSRDGDVLAPLANGASASYYDDAPGMVASVAHPPTAGEPWYGLVEGFALPDLAGRYGESSLGRIAYLARPLKELMPEVCGFAGWATTVLDAPPAAAPIANELAVRGSPMRAGRIGLELSLARAEVVTVRIHDVSGRTIRTLASRRRLEAGRHALDWDGTDDGGRRIPGGVYFVKASFEGSGFAAARKAVVLR